MSSTCSEVRAFGARAQQQLHALAFGEGAVAGRGRAQHLDLRVRRRVELGEQAIAFAEQVVADVQRHRLAVGLVQRRLAVAHLIAVFDVVVDQ